MLEDMIRQIFDQYPDVQIEVHEADEVINLHDHHFGSRPFSALLTVAQEPDRGDEWIRKLLAADLYGPVICLSLNATNAKIYNLKIAMTEVDDVSVESLPMLLRQNSYWFH